MKGFTRLVVAFVLTLAAVSAAFAVPATWVPVLWQSASIHDGISLNFATNSFYVKAPGVAARRGNFTDFFTFTRNSIGTFVGPNGLVQYANENQSLRSNPTVAQLGFSTGVTDDSSVVWGVFPTGTAGIAFGNNSVVRAAYTNSALAVGGTGTAVTGSVYVQMTDLGVPVLGTSAVTGDFSILINGNYPSANSGVTQGCSLVVSAIYRCWSTAVQNAGAANYGVIKDTGTSARSFVVTGFQFQSGTNLGSFIPTSGAFKFDQPRVEYDVSTAGTNYLLQSQAFDNASWPKNNWTATANGATAPDGSATAEIMTENGVNSVHSADQAVTITANTTYTASVYMKSTNRAGLVKFRDVADTNGCVVVYNLQTAAVIVVAGNYGTGSGAVSSIKDVGNSWYRISISCNINSSVTAATVSVRAYNGAEGYAGDGVSTVQVWGAQLDTGALPTQYTLTTTTAPQFTNSSPLARGLLIEEAKTNLDLQSADFGTTWTPSSATVSVNQAVAPDGTSTADKLVSSNATAAMFVSQSTTLSATTVYTMSVWAKRIPGEVQFLMLRSDVDGGSICSFDLQAGTNFTTQAPWFNSKIENYPNGWYRISCAYTTVGTAYNFRIYLDNTGNSGSYTGDGVKGVYIWGAQLELGQFASSYIPTTTATVTRAAESAIRTLGSEFNTNAGTAVIVGRASPGVHTGSIQTPWEINDGVSGSNRFVLLRVQSADTARFNVFLGGVAQGPVDGTFVNSTIFKSAAAWAVNDLAHSFNGSAAITDNSASLPNGTKLELGSSTLGNGQANGHVKTFDYYPVRQPNEFLINKSTLGPQSWNFSPANDNERRAFG